MTLLLGNALSNLLSPRGLDALCADPGLIPNALEEVIRFDSPQTGWRRITTQATTLGGIDLPAGTQVFLNLGAANRDPDEFPDLRCSILGGRRLGTTFRSGRATTTAWACALRSLRPGSCLTSSLSDPAPSSRAAEFETPQHQPAAPLGSMWPGDPQGRLDARGVGGANRQTEAWLTSRCSSPTSLDSGGKPGIIARMMWRVVGLLAVAVGAIGVVLPGLPTTVFFIIAAWAFSKSSPRLEAWVLGLPRIGPMVADHRSGLGMPRRAKRVAVSMIAVFVALSFWWLGWLGAMGDPPPAFSAWLRRLSGADEGTGREQLSQGRVARPRLQLRVEARSGAPHRRSRPAHPLGCGVPRAIDEAPHEQGFDQAGEAGCGVERAEDTAHPCGTEPVRHHRWRQGNEAAVRHAEHEETTSNQCVPAMIHRTKLAASTLRATVQTENVESGAIAPSPRRPAMEAMPSPNRSLLSRRCRSWRHSRRGRRTG